MGFTESYQPGKKVHYAYGEDNRWNPNAITGNEWLMYGASPEPYEVKLEGQYYSFEIPADAYDAVTTYKANDGNIPFKKGFRFNYCQLGAQGTPSAWSKIHEHRKELGTRYINLGKGPDGNNRNGIFYDDLVLASSMEADKTKDDLKEYMDISTDQGEKWIDITNHLRWSIVGGRVHIKKEPQGNKIIKIQDTNEFSWHFYKSNKHYKSGFYYMTAVIKHIDVKGTKHCTTYCSGIFQTVIEKNGKEISWFPDDILNDAEWTTKKTDVAFLDNRKKDKGVLFKIGLQQAKGTIYVKNIHAYYKTAKPGDFE